MPEDFAMPEGERLWRLHQELPAWFAEAAVRLACAGRRSVSLYALRQSLAAAHVSVRDLRDALRAFAPAGLSLGGGTRHRIQVPPALRAFWQMVVVPAFGADAASLSSYVAHLGRMTRTQMRDDADLGRLGRPQAWRMGIQALRHELLREFFSRPDMVRARLRRFASSSPGVAALPALSFRDGWKAAQSLCAHPFCSDDNGRLRLGWAAVRPATPKRLASPGQAVPFARCLPPLPHGAHARATRVATWPQQALNAVQADENAAALLRWWAGCVPADACHVENCRLYADADGLWRPLLVATGTAEQWHRLLHRLAAAKAISREGDGWRLTELGLAAGRDEAPPGRLVRATWSRVSDKLTIRLSHDWPAEAHAMLRQIGLATKDGIVITPRLLRASGLSAPAIFALLGLFLPLSARMRDKLLLWRQRLGKQP